MDQGEGEDDYLGLRCVATGWGQTTQQGGLEARLHQVNLRVVDNRSCDRVYGLRYGVNIDTGHLCAGPDLGTVTGTCVVCKVVTSYDGRDLIVRLALTADH